MREGEEIFTARLKTEEEEEQCTGEKKINSEGVSLVDWARRKREVGWLEERGPLPWVVSAFKQLK